LLNIASWGGNAGRLLVVSSSQAAASSDWGYADNPGGTITITPAQIAAIANNGTDVLLQANNDITLAAGSNITISGSEVGGLIFRAGRSILLNGNITSDGIVNLYANDTAANGVQAAYRDSGLANVTMALGTVIDADAVLIHLLDGLTSGTAGGITLSTVRGRADLGLDFLGNVLLTGSASQRGRLAGNGSIAGNLTVTNATLAPGQSPGNIDITGNLTLGSGSVLEIEFGGISAGQFDQVNVSGAATLGGALELLSYNGYVPPAGSNVAFLAAASGVSGRFASVIDPGNLAANLTSIPGVEPPPPITTENIQSVLQAERQVKDVVDEVAKILDRVADKSPLDSIDRMLDAMLRQADETNPVAATQKLQAAAARLDAKRETRLQTFNLAISELRNNPRSADVAECAAGNSGAAGNCLATRKQRDLDKLIADAPTDTRKRVALLIGNDAYTGDIPALRTPIFDVEAIAARLKAKHGFEVTVLRNAKKTDIIREMNRLATGTVVADSVMVVYAGHGYQDETDKSNKGMGYWIPVDAKSNSAAGWVSNQDISKLLYAIPARQVMLVSDSCFSGSLTREQRVMAVKGMKRDDVLKQRSVMVLSSGGEEPVTDEGRDNHSIFAWNLLNTLDKAEGGLTGFDLYRQVHEGVVKEFPQQPQYGASIFAGHKGDGDYYLDRLN
jgi:hypothetical protein